MKSSRRQCGFTLVEIAIVLVIIGLLLGGVLKGQELITSARVKNLGDQVKGMQTAFFAFQDRYRAIPGDLTAAQVAASGVAAMRAATINPGDSVVAADDSATAFQNLTAAGFIACSVCTATGASTVANSPTNAWGAPMQITTDNAYTGTPVARHNVKTGNQVPVEMMAELDRKLDDGNASTGSLRHSEWNGGAAACQVNGAWSNAGAQPNCGGAWFL